MSSYLLLTVFVMAVMTYLPRMLPLTFFKKEIHSRFIRSLLYYVPYAVLSALTFPSILYATGHMGSALDVYKRQLLYCMQRSFLL